MKEGGESVNPGKRTSGSGSGGVRSESEKEKTKMRERQRRGITTNIFHGLRKHGGYRLTPRADINEVLRHLAKEAGWIIEPDGTTYRSTPSSSILNRCPLCGTARSSTPTPTSSVVNGEISLTAEVGNNGDIPFGLYVYGNHEGVGAHVCNSNEEVVAYGHLQEPRPSNQPVASPIPRT